MILFLDGHHGIYVPQLFAQQIDRSKVQGVDKDEWDILEAGPNHDDYWHVWSDVLDSAVIDGSLVLYQDGDLWLATHDELEKMEN